MAFLIVILSQISIFQTAIEAFLARFEGANESEGGLQSVLIDRYLGGLYSALFMGDKVPLIGVGIGAFTNIGVVLLKNVNGIIVEGEWQRIVLEQGIIMGLIVIYIRTAIAFKALVTSYKSLAYGNILPWLLTSLFLLNVPQGQWKQPTSLGFSVMIGGLLFASLKFKRKYLNPPVISKD